MSYERQFEIVETILPSGTTVPVWVDSDALAQDRADEVAISGAWEKWAHPGFEESTRQIAETALLDLEHGLALVDDDEWSYWKDEERVAGEGIAHGPYPEESSTDFYSQYNGLMGAINEAWKSGSISSTRAEVMRNNADPWDLQAYYREQAYIRLIEEAEQQDAIFDYFKEQEAIRLAEQEQHDALDFVDTGDDVDEDLWRDEDDVDDICGGICGQPANSCTCAETESFIRFQADPDTRGSWWVA